MVNKSEFEEKLREELRMKANEAGVSDEVFSKIIKQIEEDERVGRIRQKKIIGNSITKRLAAVSLCCILTIVGMSFAFPEEVKAAAVKAVDTLKTIFVLDKSGDEYKIVEKNAEDYEITYNYCTTSYLSDEELTYKMGFKVNFPLKLNYGFTYADKAEGLFHNKKLSLETHKKIEADMIKAISDDEAFDRLKEYGLYRDVFATYIKADNKIFIELQASDSPDKTKEEAINIIISTKVGDADASWVESYYPEYKFIMENGIGKSDLYEKPERVIKSHSLVWVSNGVRYILSMYKDFDLTMEEAVKIAESFMAGGAELR